MSSRIQTAGSISTATSATAWRGEVVLGIIGNKGNEVGVCACNLHTMEFTLMQFSDQPTLPQTLTLVHQLGVAEIVLPSTTVETELSNTLRTSLKESVTFLAVPRRDFNEVNGLRFISHIAVNTNVISELSSSNKYLSVACAAAVIRYVEYLRKTTLAPKSTRVAYRCIHDRVSIDRASCGHLGLIQPSVKQKSGTLMAHVDHTLTQGGKRLLRSNLLMPICNKTTLETRLVAVAALREKDAARQDVRKQLKSVQSDVDHLLSKFATPSPSNRDVNYTETTIKHVLGLRGVINAVPALSASLEPLTSAVLLSSIEDAFNTADLDAIKDRIDTVIDTAVQKEKKVSSSIAKTILVFSVRSGIDGMLDVVRSQYSSILEQIYSTAGLVSKEYSMTSLKVVHTSTRGFVLQCDRSEISKGAETFLMRTFSKRKAQFSTQELVSLNNKLRDAYGEIITRTNIQICTLVDAIRKKMNSFFRVSEAISLLDLLQSAATHSIIHEGYCAPKFSTTNTTKIKQGRHPLWDGGVKGGGSYIPNDTTAEGGKLLLLSGPNMSGKTTYLTQVATIMVMAHMGLYVPAVEAELPLLDSVFTRLGLDDSIEANASTFTMEMREAAHLLRNSTPRSLVVIDELGRGTSNLEGAALAFSIAERLAKIECLTIFATHYVQLHCLPSIHSNAVNVHFTVKPEGEALRCLYKLESGSCSLSRYGISLAREMKFPPDVLRLANEMSTKLLVEESTSLARDHWKLLHTYADKFLGVIFGGDHLPDGDRKICLERIKTELEAVVSIDELLRHASREDVPVPMQKPVDVENECPTQLIEDAPSWCPSRKRPLAPSSSTPELNLSSSYVGTAASASVVPQWGFSSDAASPNLSPSSKKSPAFSWDFH